MYEYKVITIEIGEIEGFKNGTLKDVDRYVEKTLNYGSEKGGDIFHYKLDNAWILSLVLRKKKDKVARRISY